MDYQVVFRPPPAQISEVFLRKSHVPGSVERIFAKLSLAAISQNLDSPVPDTYF
jgi:hypothetical protein